MEGTAPILRIHPATTFYVGEVAAERGLRRENRKGIGWLRRKTVDQVQGQLAVQCQCASVNLIEHIVLRSCRSPADFEGKLRRKIELEIAVDVELPGRKSRRDRAVVGQCSAANDSNRAVAFDGVIAPVTNGLSAINYHLPAIC